MPFDQVHRYATCVLCGKTMDVRTKEFSEHTHSEKEFINYGGIYIAGFKEEEEK